jgi:hypothetical protein
MDQNTAAAAPSLLQSIGPTIVKKHNKSSRRAQYNAESLLLAQPPSGHHFEHAFSSLTHYPHYPLAGAFEPVGAPAHTHVHVTITDGADDHVGCICHQWRASTSTVHPSSPSSAQSVRRLQ